MAGRRVGPDDERLVYSLRETALRLGVSLSTIEKAVRDRALRSVKLGRRRLIQGETGATEVAMNLGQNNLVCGQGVVPRGGETFQDGKTLAKRRGRLRILCILE